jgi:hypothetical protein
LPGGERRGKTRRHPSFSARERACCSVTPRAMPSKAKLTNATDRRIRCSQKTGAGWARAARALDRPLAGRLRLIGHLVNALAESEAHAEGAAELASRGNGYLPAPAQRAVFAPPDAPPNGRAPAPHTPHRSKTTRPAPAKPRPGRLRTSQPSTRLARHVAPSAFRPADRWVYAPATRCASARGGRLGRPVGAACTLAACRGDGLIGT